MLSLLALLTFLFLFTLARCDNLHGFLFYKAKHLLTLPTFRAVVRHVADYNGDGVSLLGLQCEPEASLCLF